MGEIGKCLIVSWTPTPTVNECHLEQHDGPSQMRCGPHPRTGSELERILKIFGGEGSWAWIMWAVDGGREAHSYRIFLELVWPPGLDHSTKNPTMPVFSPRTTPRLLLDQEMTIQGSTEAWKMMGQEWALLSDGVKPRLWVCVCLPSCVMLENC